MALPRDSVERNWVEAEVVAAAAVVPLEVHAYVLSDEVACVVEEEAADSLGVVAVVVDYL